jgi:hypothetical protein
MKSDARDTSRDGLSLMAAIVGIAFTALALWLASWASGMSPGPYSGLYFGMDAVAWIGAGASALIGLPLVFVGLRHFTRDVRPGSDG